jgi:hypothetical protein
MPDLDPLFVALAYRLALMEVSIYRNRCQNLRRVAKATRSLHNSFGQFSSHVDAVMASLNYSSDASYHALANELRTIRRHMKTLHVTLDPSEFPIDLENDNW